jgi:hypothetical protein
MAKMKDPLSAEAWWGRVNACRQVKQEKRPTLQDNVSYRRGKPFKGTPSEDTVNIPADWSKTKNKQSQLFFQVPEVILKARRPEWAAATSVFAAALNFELTEKVHAEHVMNECLGDLINATGIMICMVSYEAEFEEKPLDGGMAAALPPAQDPGQMLTSGSQVEGTSVAPLPDVSVQGGAGSPAPFAEGGGEVPVKQGEIVPDAPAPEMLPMPIYECYKAERVSLLHFLWPIEFVGTDWQKASFLGREGYLPLAEAIRREWVPEGTEGVQINDEEWLLINENPNLKPFDSYIKYCELFYHPHTFDPNEKDPRKIKRIVLVETGRGEKSKVVDEDFKWQKKDPATGRWVGMTTYPLKVGTIAHISDMAIPPSDSEVGRPQVRELIKSRTQMVRQRDHSMPLRWFDVNQVDAIIGDKLRRGKWQDMIPMNGPGANAIGEVARAHYPPENWNFDKVIKADLDEAWSMGAMQQGVTTPGETTATEVREMKGANDVRLAYEQQWVARFFLEIAAGVGQLMQMFADDTDYAYVVGEDGAAALKQWNKDLIAGEYIFSIRPDSQLRLDVSQQRAEALNLYKLLRKDPLVDPAALVRKLLEAHGMDPTKAMAKPQPPQPPGPKISATVKGEDLMSPMAVALINKSNTPITEQDIAAAVKLIQSAAVLPPPVPPVVPGAEGQPGGAPDTSHPGPAPVVQPLNRRYEKAETGAEGSRDSSLPTTEK